MKNSRELMTNSAITRLYDMRLITTEQEPAARTLYRSCLQAYERTKDIQKPAYFTRVKFQFDSPLDMAMQFISKLPNEWSKWQEFQTVYDSRLEEDDDSSRPSIDRIDSNGHYSIDNLQTETLKGNYMDASNRRRKPVAIMVVEDGKLSHKFVDSMTIARNELNVSSTKLKNMKSIPYNLMSQSGDDTLIDTGKQVFVMPAYQVTRKEYLQMEVERLQEVQAGGTNMGWINEEIAELTLQINDPVAMESALKRKDKADYQDLQATIQRFEAMSADRVDQPLLDGMRHKMEIYKANGYHLL